MVACCRLWNTANSLSSLHCSVLEGPQDPKLQTTGQTTRTAFGIVLLEFKMSLLLSFPFSSPLNWRPFFFLTLSKQWIDVSHTLGFYGLVKKIFFKQWSYRRVPNNIKRPSSIMEISLKKEQLQKSRYSTNTVLKIDLNSCFYKLPSLLFSFCYEAINKII